MSTFLEVFTRGQSTYVDSGDATTDHSGLPIVPMLKDQTVLLMRLGFGDVLNLDGASAGTWTLTLTAAETFDGSPAFSVAAISEDWSPSVGYADNPTVFGSPVTFSGAISAGGSITVDISSLASAIAGGRVDYGLAIKRTDVGTAGSFYGCSASAGLSPSLVGEVVFPMDAPTGLLPRSGGIVGEPRPVFSANAPAGNLTGVQFQIIQSDTEPDFDVTTGIDTPDFDSGEWLTDVPEFPSDDDDSDMDPLVEDSYYWAFRLEDESGWGEWTMAQFGGYVAKPDVTLTAPLVSGIVEDPNPKYSWTVDGTQTGFQAITTRLDGTTADDSGYTTTAATSYQTVSNVLYGTLVRGTDSGVVLPDSSLTTLELHVFDDTANRQATPGCPVYTLVTQDYRFSSNETIPAPDSVRAVQVGASPFVALNVTLSFKLADDDYLIHMLNGVHITRRSGKSMGYTESEGTFTYHYRYFAAQPFAPDGYQWSAKVVVGDQTSAESDRFFMSSLEVAGLWAGDADPQSDTYGTIAYHSGVGSTFTRVDQYYLQATLGGQFPMFQHNSKGWIQGELRGTIRDAYDETATHWEANWHRLCGRGNVVMLAYDNIAYPAVIVNFATAELDGSGSPWMKQIESMTAYQVDSAQLAEEPTGEEGGLIDYDFERLVSGDATVDGDPLLRETAPDGTGSEGVLDIDGSPKYSLAAGIHSSDPDLDPMGIDLGWDT